MKKLNENIQPYDYPTPLQDQHLENFVGCNIFSSIDFRSGYWQSPLDPQSRDVTSFTVPDMGKFRFTRLLQGCSVSAQYFAEILNHFLKDIRTVPPHIAQKRYGGLCNYFDDISVFSEDFDLNLFLLRALFTNFRAANMCLNLNKSKFGYKKLKVLGYVAEHGVIQIDPSRVEAIKKIR